MHRLLQNVTGYAIIEPPVRMAGRPTGEVVIAMSIMETYALLDMIFGIILEIVAIFVTVITIIVTRKK